MLNRTQNYSAACQIKYCINFLWATTVREYHVDFFGPVKYLKIENQTYCSFFSKIPLMETAKDARKFIIFNNTYELALS